MLFWWIWKCFYVLDDLFFLPFFFSFLFFPSFLFCYHKRHSIIQNLFQKLNIFKTERISSEIWDRQWHKPFSVMPVFIALILLLLFQIIKKCQCCGFTFTNFFFLRPPMPLRLVEKLFRKPGYLCFSNFLICFPIVAWWK